MKHKKSTTIFLVLALSLIIALTTTKGDLFSVTNKEMLGQSLGAITLLPTVLAVVLVFITKNVLFSLLLGFVSGVIILTVSSTTSLVHTPVIFASKMFQSITNVIFDIDNIEVMILCLVIGGMVETIRTSGGFEALAQKLTIRINTPREAGITAGLIGLLIMFDDYANALIVGPIMKPIVDRVKVSREKLAYLVDSTCAQVAGIALVSSWIGVEISAIQKGLNIAGSNIDSFSLFISSIPYSFYCIFSISFIFLGSLLDRDFGPMLKAEKRARAGQTISNESKENIIDEQITIKDKIGKRIFVSVTSILILVVFAIVSFYVTGRKTAIENNILTYSSAFNLENILIAISCADTINLISLAALVSSIYALVLGCIFKLFNLKQGLSSWIKGMGSLLSTCLLLLMAWCLADVIEAMGTTYFAIEIISANVPTNLVPLLIFITCCIISLTSGSFGCLFVVMPLAIPLAFKMISLGVDIKEETYLLICVGSVIAGSIFGDHCSPVMDCTILSSLGSGCTTMEHCITQLPYSIVILIVSIVCGIILTSIGFNVLLAILIGLLAQILILLIIGRKPV